MLPAHLLTARQTSPLRDKIKSTLEVDMHLVIIGAGGHSKVVFEAAVSAGISHITVIDELAGETLETKAPDASHFIVAIGDNAVRERSYNAYVGRETVAGALKALTVIHPTACVSPSAHIAEGSFVGPHAVINAEAEIGKNVIVNTAAVIEHDCVLGDHSFVAPSSSLCGGVHIGERALVGTNATILPLVHLGSDSVLGAGSVLNKTMGNNCVAVGAPAKVIKNNE